MNRNYCFRLYPSKAQEMEMLEVLDSCRKLYNHFLGKWKESGKVPPKYDLQARIPYLVRQWPELENVHSKTRQYVLWQLYSNLKGLKGLKAKGRKVGRLRFKKYGRMKSFVYNQSGFKLVDNKLHLSKIGSIPIKLHRKIEGNIKQVYIKREQSGRWFAIFSVEVEPEKLGTTGRAIGLDLNIENYLTDSNGKKIEHPHTLLKLEDKLKREQRKLAKKKKCSKNRLKQILKVARVHERVTDRRRDFLHKLSRYYVDNYDIICVEDLAVREMMQSSYNAKNTADSSWSTFTQILSYKAEGAGRTFMEVDPKNTTQNCSRCGNRVYKQIWIRTHNCPTCGLLMDRDHNAAINILNKALLEVGSVRPELTPVEMRPLLHPIGGACLVKEAGILSKGGAI
ncbi:MAG: transposase [Candidatus Altiarchaeales archaeon]|nr:transposase [Candidatus Altiarchaeota archaeon]MBU4406372.1 transposase [Candidatus Altiarchaeota archaeon]MBU4437492.1 transposase [Candidatus Altiarchaeota archaeon]MCG2782412.1 transposase [Candidatus Altiarchaeales archaeon]